MFTVKIYINTYHVNKSPEPAPLASRVCEIYACDSVKYYKAASDEAGPMPEHLALLNKDGKVEQIIDLGERVYMSDNDGKNPLPNGIPVSKVTVDKVIIENAAGKTTQVIYVSAPGTDLS